nr:MAG TPA: hypothetical protein [Caudoviricetes sp.]
MIILSTGFLFTILLGKILMTIRRNYLKILNCFRI